MSIFRYGPSHPWFAWHPVRTSYHGWAWLTMVIRRRVYADVPRAPADGWWEYTPMPPSAATPAGPPTPAPPTSSVLNAKTNRRQLTGCFA